MIWFNIVDTFVDDHIESSIEIEDDCYGFKLSIPIVRFKSDKDGSDPGACCNMGCPGRKWCSKDIYLFQFKDDICTWMAEMTVDWNWYLDVPSEIVPALFETLFHFMEEHDAIIKKRVFMRRKKG